MHNSKLALLLIVLLTSLVAASASYGNSILVRPQEATLESGAGIKCEAQVFSEENAPVTVDKYEWKVVPEDLGSITEDGFFIAGRMQGKGEIIVSAKIGGQVYTASVKVIVGRQVESGIRIVVTPEDALVPPLTTRQFKAEAFGPNGIALRLQSIRWQVEPKSLGLIDRTGNLIAGPLLGDGQVVAMVEIDGKVYHGNAHVIVSPPANGTIAGHVNDENGPALSEAKVTVTRLGIPFWTRQSQTDEDGAYVIGRLIPGFYLVRAEARAFIAEYYDSARSLLEADPVKVAEGDSITAIDFALGMGGSISGKVVADASSEGLMGAHVEAFLTANPLVKMHALTADDGTYKLNGLIAGDYIVHANIAGYVSEFFNNVKNPLDATLVKVIEPNDTPGVDFSLASTSAIKGIVSNEADGFPIAGATVAVRTLLSDPNGRLVKFLHTTKTNEKGEYALSLNPGFYLIYCKAEGFNAEWFENATDPASATPVKVVETEHSVVDFGLLPFGGISGKVADQLTGTAIVGAKINAFFERKHERRHFVALSDAEGNYSLTGLPAGEYIVEAHAPDYMPEFWQEADSLKNATMVTVANSETTAGIDFTLSPGAIIKGTVTDKGTSAPLEKAVVTVVRRGSHLKKSAKTDEAGHYAIDGLPSGTYLAYAVAKGYYGQWYLNVDSRLEATPIEVTVPNTVEGIDFALAKIEQLQGGIAGLVLDDSTGLPIEGAVLTAMPLTFARPKQAVSGPDGSYELSGLRRGIYVVVCWANGYKGEFYNDARRWYKATPISVADGQTTSGIDFGLVPQEEGAYMITGVITSPYGEPVEGALVVAEEEDQIIATAVSSENGGYEMSGVPAGSYKLTASVSGYTDGSYAETSGSVTVGATESVYSADISLGSESTGLDSDTMLPAAFALEQNYPNPFNPSTEIQFSLPRTAIVRLKVYNLIGEEVKTIFDGQHQAGSYSVNWDGTDRHGAKMASGVYIYRLEAKADGEQFTQTRRMLMLK